MIGYGFGYDDEVPGGFQDADIEMRELEDAARDARARDKRNLTQRARESNMSTRDEGRSDGYGESYAERNV